MNVADEDQTAWKNKRMKTVHLDNFTILYDTPFTQLGAGEKVAGDTWIHNTIMKILAKYVRFSILLAIGQYKMLHKNRIKSSLQIFCNL